MLQTLVTDMAQRAAEKMVGVARLTLPAVRHAGRGACIMRVCQAALARAHRELIRLLQLDSAHCGKPYLLWYTLLATLLGSMTPVLHYLKEIIGFKGMFQRFSGQEITKGVMQ